jgi:DNA-binding beta-propeller fold protein YncE
MYAFSSCNNPTQENGDPEDTNHIGPNGDTTRLHIDIGNYLLYAGYEGNLNHGILKIDPKNFTIEDSILVDGAPFDLALSSDSSKLFVAHQEAISAINLDNFTVTNTLDVPATWLEVSNDDRFIFAAYRNLFHAVDLFSESVIYFTDSLRIRQMVADPNEPGVYAAFRHEDSTYGTNGIFHFNAESRTIDCVYSVGDTDEQRRILPRDMVITHTGLEIMFTDYEGAGLGPGAVLYHLDLTTSEYLARTNFSAGTARLAITSDDRFVFVTDPGQHLSIDVLPSGILRRYEVASRSIDGHIDTKDFYISEFYSIWPDLDQIALFPDDKHCVVSSWMDSADIMIFDLEDMQLLGMVALGRGKHTQLVRAIEIGPVPPSPP